ncbi:MAG: hypothetical protein LJE68_07970 [Rhodobacter sp.]|nr:hypothetical protein [Rhodobacter sp.]
MTNDKSGPDDDEVLAAMAPSAYRRWMAIGMLVIAGGLLIYVAFNDGVTSLVWKTIIVVGGAGVLVLADRLRRSTENAIVLTSAGLRDTGGQVLCLLDDIEKVERGAFAFKPSNGLLVRLKTPARAGWAPGLWWRFGRKIGIGGVTSAAQAKVMSDMITVYKAGYTLDKLPTLESLNK